MKTTTKILTGFVALALAGSAFADTTVRITGSSAFRAATHQAIINSLTNCAYGIVGTSIDGASQAIFKGTYTLSDGTVEAYIIETNWQGSLGGLQSVSQGLVAADRINAPGKFIPASVASSLVVGTPTTGLTASEVAQPDIAMSDTYQGSTSFSGGSYDALVEHVVGVVPFVWAKGGGTSPLASITNVNSNQLNALLSGGLRLSQITGNSADTRKVICVGRDADSGTRFGALAETGYGNSTPTSQYTINGANTDGVNTGNQSAGSGNITSFAFWPASTVLGAAHDAGDGGFFSGGKVKDALNRPITATTFTIISYLGLGDANGINPGASQDLGGRIGKISPTQNAIAFNGQKLESVPPYNSLLNGVYTFWCYEHLYYRDDAASQVSELGDALANALTDTYAEYAGVGIKLSDMLVHRDGDGTPILPGAGSF